MFGSASRSGILSDHVLLSLLTANWAEKNLVMHQIWTLFFCMTMKIKKRLLCMQKLAQRFITDDDPPLPAFYSILISHFVPMAQAAMVSSINSFARYQEKSALAMGASSFNRARFVLAIKR